MVKCLLLSVFALMSLLEICMSNGNGASWTPEETLIIQSKIMQIIEKSSKVVKEYKQIYPNREYVTATNINGPKVILYTQVDYVSCP